MLLQQLSDQCILDDTWLVVLPWMGLQIQRNCVCLLLQPVCSVNLCPCSAFGLHEVGDLVGRMVDQAA